MKKLISCILLTVLLLTQLFCINISAGEFNENCIKVTIINPSVGNIYCDEMPCFSVKLVNPRENAIDISLQYVLYDEDGNVVWESNNEEIGMKPSSRYVRKYKPDCIIYGKLTFEATISGDFGLISSTDKFSVITENKTRSMDMSAQMHLATTGVETNFDASVEETTKAGFGLIRDDVRWYHTETGKTSTKYVLYDALKTETDMFLNAGAKMILSLGMDNSIYGKGYQTTSTGIQAYADFCAFIAKSFKGKDIAFEMGNEPDNPNFSGEGYSGSDYAKQMIAGANAVNAVNKNAIIVGGGLCNMGSGTQEFMDEFLGTSGVIEAIDALSFHPYNFDHTKYSDENTKGTFLEQVEIVKSALKKHGAEKMPIWITEYGIPSIESQGLSESFQASNLIRTIAAAKSEEQIDMFSVYNFRQKNTTNAYEKGLGIVDENYNAKSAFVAISFLNKLLGSAEYAGERYFDEDLAYNGRVFGGVRFSESAGAFKEDIFVLWEHTGKTATVSVNNTQETGDASALTHENGNISIKMPADYTAKYYDMYGNLIEDNEFGVIELSQEPIYIVCSPKENIKMTISEGKISFCGKTDKPNENVAVYVTDNTETVAIGQTVSDDKGYFDFKLNATLEEDKNYFVFAFNGTKGQILQGDMADYKIDMVWYVNGVEKSYIELEKLSDGDIVKLKMNIKNNRQKIENLILYGSVIDRENILIYSDISVSDWKNGEALIEAEAVIDKKSETKQLKFFLWNEKMNPLFNSIVIE